MPVTILGHSPEQQQSGEITRQAVLNKCPPASKKRKTKRAVLISYNIQTPKLACHNSIIWTVPQLELTYTIGQNFFCYYFYVGSKFSFITHDAIHTKIYLPISILKTPWTFKSIEWMHIRPTRENSLRLKPRDFGQMSPWPLIYSRTGFLTSTIRRPLKIQGKHYQQ